MAFEIELKAHVKDCDVETIREALMRIPTMEFHGENDKYDVYWAKSPDAEPIFRTRKEVTENGPEILFTAKPNKIKTENGTEKNVELEFAASADQWDRIQEFYTGLGLTVCRVKWKKGYSYYVTYQGFEVHVELLYVKYLGWFLEMEICPESLEGFDSDAADRALRAILVEVGLSDADVESRGYNRMLKAIGHDKG
ncbi:MAG: adenylate cyclase [Sphaerochaetaceae bacterium]|nr:adenylate cyclase [Sphaerochaetaceae bacterium]